MELIPLRKWLDVPEGPVVMAGPCSAESEGQMEKVAMELSRHPFVKVLRAGIWKPRTRPDAFSGVGEPGLKWLVKSARENKLKSATEVANAYHIEAALKAGVDILWVGARTSVSPFSMQEIANELRGTDIPVLVKNPINPDLNLWIGALERLYNAGLKKLVAVHRGFSWFHESVYRNDPKWNFPVQLRTLFPNLDIICDPSHIAGDRTLIREISQKALDLDMVGLMVESHPDPKEALSDAEQQITPRALIELLNQLVIRQATSGNQEFTDQLQRLRTAIDEVDLELLEIFSRRMKLIREIGHYKKQNNVTVLQLKRWEEILFTRGKWSEKLGIGDAFTQEMLNLIHQESIRIQTRIMNEEG